MTDDERNKIKTVKQFFQDHWKLIRLIICLLFGLVTLLALIFGFWPKETLMVFLVGASIIVISLTALKSKDAATRIYYLSGSLFSWLLSFIIWSYFSPQTYKLVLINPFFWGILLSNLMIVAVLGITNLFVVCTRILCFSMLGICIIALMGSIFGYHKRVYSAVATIENNLIDYWLSTIENRDKREEQEQDMKTLARLVEKTRKGEPLSQEEEEMVRTIRARLSKKREIIAKTLDNDNSPKKKKKEKKGKNQVSEFILPRDGQKVTRDIEGRKFTWETGEKLCWIRTDGHQGRFGVFSDKEAKEPAWTNPKARGYTSVAKTPGELIIAAIPPTPHLSIKFYTCR